MPHEEQQRNLAEVQERQCRQEAQKEGQLQQMNLFMDKIHPSSGSTSSSNSQLIPVNVNALSTSTTASSSLPPSQQQLQLQFQLWQQQQQQVQPLQPHPEALLASMQNTEDAFWHVRWKDLEQGITGKLGNGSYGHVYRVSLGGGGGGG
jgi:hypothetical protein